MKCIKHITRKCQMDISNLFGKWLDFVEGRSTHLAKITCESGIIVIS